MYNLIRSKPTSHHEFYPKFINLRHTNRPLMILSTCCYTFLFYLYNYVYARLSLFAYSARLTSFVSMSTYHDWNIIFDYYFSIVQALDIDLPCFFSLI